MGLTGDTSDNIPGVPGIGPKTATQLIEEFGSIEELLKNLDRVKNSRVRASLERYAEQARLSRELATLDSDSPWIGIGRLEKGRARPEEAAGDLQRNGVLQAFEGFFSAARAPGR